MSAISYQDSVGTGVHIPANSLPDSLLDKPKEYLGPQVTIGDLNSSVHGILYKKVSQNLIDLKKGLFWSRTWNAKNPFVRITIDHAFGSRHIQSIDYRVGRSIGSDHFPIILELGISIPVPVQSVTALRVVKGICFPSRGFSSGKGIPLPIVCDTLKWKRYK